MSAYERRSCLCMCSGHYPALPQRRESLEFAHSVRPVEIALSVVRTILDDLIECSL
jgi:hypothetical protein